jgi:AraC family transcriptional regulator
MYFTSLPDHTEPGFDDALHFSRFKKNNIIFNAVSNNSYCAEHIGCLSFKTVLNGEEWYGIDHHRVAVRPGQFLVLNDDQPYSCYSNKDEPLKVLSLFFKKEFAASVCWDATNKTTTLLDDPFTNGENIPEFFQSLHELSPALQYRLSVLTNSLDTSGYDAMMADEQLVLILHHLMETLVADTRQLKNVQALKPATQKEVYKRLCIAKDMLQSSYMDDLDLQAIGNGACLSVPQLVRQFKAVFHTTPHQYLMQTRLQRAAEKLQQTNMPIHEIGWQCGFQNDSAFCRAFKLAYGVQPLAFRNAAFRN